jgi:hypothetical protein
MTCAADCGSGLEPALKINYEAEDYVICDDPRLANLPPSTPRGIFKAVLYQTRTKRRIEVFGQCVKAADLTKTPPVYKNSDLHNVNLYTNNRVYSIDLAQKNGSVRAGSQDDVFEVHPKAYSASDFKKYKRMKILPGYECGILPQIPHDPSKMKLCVADIDGMRVVLYKELFRIGSEELNWYKATNIQKTCLAKDIFEPPANIDLVRL